MFSLKVLAGAVAAAAFSLAFAQGTPPKPAADPAVGAGQRSTQNTPMGATGTPGGNGAAAQGSMAGSTAASTAASTSGSTSMGASSDSSSTMASDTGAGKSTMSNKHRKARADRN